MAQRSWCSVTVWRCCEEEEEEEDKEEEEPRPAEEETVANVTHARWLMGEMCDPGIRCTGRHFSFGDVSSRVPSARATATSPPPPDVSWTVA